MPLKLSAPASPRRYTALRRSARPHATIALSEDARRGLNVDHIDHVLIVDDDREIRDLLSTFSYPGKDRKLARPDPKIVFRWRKDRRLES